MFHKKLRHEGFETSVTRNRVSFRLLVTRDSRDRRVKYVPPFESLRESLRMTVIRGKPTPNMSYDDIKRMISRLLMMVDVDEEWYLQRNPDIAEAVREGRTRSGREHFVNNGYFEGRQPFPIPVDEDWYLAQNPAVAEAIREGLMQSAQQHFELHGYREGRLPFPV